MIIDVTDAGFAYGSTGRTVFSGISFGVESGEICCILGPNGVGKTSLLKCICGLLALSEGTITCQGKPIDKISRMELARTLAYVPQMHAPVFAYSVFEIVLMGRTPFLGFFSFPTPEDERIAQRTMQSLEIDHLSDKPYTQISGGERQLVLLARTLAQEPRIIILDEPTSHLDYGNQVKILSLIRRLSRKGVAVIMTSHNPDHALMVADTVAVMHKGSLQGYGQPADVITEGSLFRIYGIPLRLRPDKDFGQRCVPVLPG